MLITKLRNVALLAVAFAMPAFAQSGGNFQITQSVVSNAGGRVSGGNYSLEASAGQAVAGSESNGVNFKLLHGYWTAAVAQSVTPRAKAFDFDGDGKTDPSVFRASNGEWWYLKSSDGQNRAFQFGNGTDKLVPADFTGDGKTDIAVWRPSTGAWLVLRSEDSSYYSFPFGATGDVPAPGDFDGDGKGRKVIFF